MKAKIFSIPLLLIIVVMMAFCNKENFNYPPGTVGRSTIIYFPSIAIKGEHIMAIDQDSSFTDPGATATLGGTSVSYTVSPSVDSSVPGIYTLTYTAQNAQGFTATDFRMVVVIPTTMVTDPTVQSNDFSGTYLRAATGQTSTWTKIGVGTYLIQNPGGA